MRRRRPRRSRAARRAHRARADCSARAPRAPARGGRPRRCAARNRQPAQERDRGARPWSRSSASRDGAAEGKLPAALAKRSALKHGTLSAERRRRRARSCAPYDGVAARRSRCAAGGERTRDGGRQPREGRGAQDLELDDRAAAAEMGRSSQGELSATQAFTDPAERRRQSKARHELPGRRADAVVGRTSHADRGSGSTRCGTSADPAQYRYRGEPAPPTVYAARLNGGAARARPSPAMCLSFPGGGAAGDGRRRRRLRRSSDADPVRRAAPRGLVQRELRGRGGGGGGSPAGGPAGGAARRARGAEQDAQADAHRRQDPRLQRAGRKRVERDRHRAPRRGLRSTSGRPAP